MPNNDLKGPFPVEVAAVCNNLASSEAAVCNYISNKANHAIFDNRYPEDFPGVWD